MKENISKLTNEQKRKLAYVLISQAANIVENLQCGNTGYLQEIETLDPMAVAAQLSKWLSGLPGNTWDDRLPQPS